MEVPVKLSPCAVAEVPLLPTLPEAKKLYTTYGIKTLANRDIIMRSYIKSLQQTIMCYESQVTTDEKHALNQTKVSHEQVQVK